MAQEPFPLNVFCIPLFAKVGVDYQNLLAETKAMVDKLPKAYGGAVNIGLSRGLYQILTEAQTEADKFKDEYVSTEHVLLALADDDGPIQTSRDPADSGGRRA